MSDFPKAIARISEGFCPVHGVGLRQVSQRFYDGFLERHVVANAPPVEMVAQCGMCPDGRLWWVEKVDGRPMLRAVPELDTDERRMVYDRGEG